MTGRRVLAAGRERGIVISGRHTAFPPEDLNQHGVVEAAQAQVMAAEVETAGGGGQRRRGPGLSGRRVHQSHVLDEDVQRAAGRLELALDHPGPPVVEHEGRRGALPQHLPAVRRRQAERLRERQRLGGSGDAARRTAAG